jgi:pimeloyl-ACP methyl ester carboxylesterase
VRPLTDGEARVGDARSMTKIRPTFRDIGGLSIHAREGGTGSVVVLLHAEPGDSSMLATTAELLARHHRVLVPDLRGHGLSAKPRGDYSIPTQSAHVLAYLDAAGVERCTLVGSSYGGIIAMYLAAQVPERVIALVLSGTNAYAAYRLPWRARLLSSWAGRLVAPLVPSRAIECAYLEQFFDPAGVDRVHVDAVMRALAGRETRRCLWRQAHQLDFRAVESRLSHIRAPALLVWGRQDHATPLAWAQRLEVDLRRAHLTVVEECGHYPPLEQPEAFAEITLGFLAAVR